MTYKKLQSTFSLVLGFFSGIFISALLHIIRNNGNTADYIAAAVCAAGIVVCFLRLSKLKKIKDTDQQE